MKDAKQLFQDYIDFDAQAQGDLFYSDGYLELPFLASLGMQSNYTGPAEVTQFLSFLHTQLAAEAISKAGLEEVLAKRKAVAA